MALVHVIYVVISAATGRKCQFRNPKGKLCGQRHAI